MTEFEQVGPFRLYPRAAAVPGYCLSRDGFWLPGAYESRDAAMLAAGAWLCDWQRASKQLKDLQERAYGTPSGLITMALLAEAASP